MRTMVALTLIALASAPPCAARGPKVPAGQWAVEYARDTCVLSREGMNGEANIAIRTRPMVEQHDLLINTASSGRTAISVKGHLYGEAAGTPERWITTEQLTGGSKRWIMSSISASELAASARTGVVGLTAPNGFAIKAALPMIDRAMTALRLCEDDLARKWGVDPVAMRQWAHPARADRDLRELFWSKDKRRVAIFRNPGFRAVLDIDPVGKVTNCTILQSSRVGWADRKICEGLKNRALIHPAIDHAGHAVRGKLVTPIITSVLIR